MLSEQKVSFANLPDQLLIYRRHERSLSHDQSEPLQAERYDVHSEMLLQLWCEAPRESIERFLRLRMRQKLGWLERRAARKDLLRLIDSLIAHDLVDANDRRGLLAHMQRSLEGSMPRHLQMFLHWWRHRIGHGILKRDVEAESAQAVGDG